MENEKRLNFFKDMKLTKNEIQTFEKYVGVMERAQKNSVEFINSEALAFTPAALLVVAVAKFVYDVYQDYGAVATDPREFQTHFKSIIKDLNRLEELDGDVPSLDVYARLRKTLIAAKKSSK